MSCEKWVKQIFDRLSGSLSARETSELEEHLGRCPACRAELALQREIEKALAVEVHSGLSADFTKMVSAKALRIETKIRSPRPWPVLVPPLAAAAAVAALYFMGMNLAGEHPYVFGQVAGALVKPIAWISGLLGGAVEQAPALDQASTRVAGLVGALLAGTIPAFWGLRRFIVYLR
jgi:anti-sigma factor RsiW